LHGDTEDDERKKLLCASNGALHERVKLHRQTSEAASKSDQLTTGSNQNTASMGGAEASGKKKRKKRPKKKRGAAQPGPDLEPEFEPPGPEPEQVQAHELEPEPAPLLEPAPAPDPVATLLAELGLPEHLAACSEHEMDLGARASETFHRYLYQCSAAVLITPHPGPLYAASNRFHI
jgi:hypothetical protein